MRTIAVKLSLACERIIVGKSAHKPVDYSILIDWTDFVFTEVKLKEIFVRIGCMLAVSR